MLVITIFDVHTVSCGFYYYVGFILQCAMVVITTLDVFCSVPCFSLLLWIFNITSIIVRNTIEHFNHLPK